MSGEGALVVGRWEGREALGEAVERIDHFYRTLPDRKIGPALSMPAIEAAVAGFDFDRPETLPTVTHRMAEALAEGNLLSLHPRCFGLFNPTPDPAGVVADLLVSAFNPQLAVSSHAPLSVAAERRVIGLLTGLLWPNVVASGHFTSGGAEANMTGLLLAATHACPAFEQAGARAFGGQPVFYASAESHFAWFKIAHQLGLGRAAVRLIATDGSGRLDPAALDDALATDRAHGRTPLAVIATAGTTNAGMVDPLAAMASIAAREGLWFHVDAAWAGALLLADSLPAELAALGLADSVTIDAHKWLNAPMGAGMFLTRHPEALARTFHVAASYMPSGDGDDPYVRSAQWSRRNVGLRLFMILASRGKAGIAERLGQQRQLAERLAAELDRAGWHVANASPCAVLVFTDRGGADPAGIVRRVQDEGDCWISLARFEGQAVIRACITSTLTTEKDIGLLVASLSRARDELRTAALPR